MEAINKDMELIYFLIMVCVFLLVFGSNRNNKVELSAEFWQEVEKKIQQNIHRELRSLVDDITKQTESKG